MRGRLHTQKIRLYQVGKIRFLLGADLRKFPQERAKNGVVGRLTDFYEQLIRLKRSVYIQRLGRTFSN